MRRMATLPDWLGLTRPNLRSYARRDDDEEIPSIHDATYNAAQT